jgi:diaminopimelate epimerase
VPGGQNVEFATVGQDRGVLELVTWERGAGLTLACGSGSCAAAAAARYGNLVGDRVAVHNPGGTVVVELRGAPDAPEIVLTGAARRIASIDLSLSDLGDLLFGPSGPA